MTQEQLGIALGLRGEKIRNRICRYERDGRIPKGDRLNEIAEILQISEGMLRNYNFIDSSDFVYQMFWVEELIPDFEFFLRKKYVPLVDTTETFASAYRDWRREQIKLEKKLIDRREYVEWKLTYKVKK
ncbi:MAG: helix-turn-helix domain-containing protein [Lachnospiraceae bacterium]|nr:helix-turn-helix domain-containing protein [Lachnospiraceae bacterium]